MNKRPVRLTPVELAALERFRIMDAGGARDYCVCGPPDLAPVFTLRCHYYEYPIVKTSEPQRGRCYAETVDPLLEDIERAIRAVETDLSKRLCSDARPSLPPTGSMRLTPAGLEMLEAFRTHKMAGQRGYRVGGSSAFPVHIALLWTIQGQSIEWPVLYGRDQCEVGTGDPFVPVLMRRMDEIHTIASNCLGGLATS